MRSSSRLKQQLSFAQRAAATLVKWQETMRLQDWDIALEIKRRHDMPQDGLGLASIRLNELSAIIILQDPDDISPEWETDMDVELTIVHELVHLKTHQALLTQDKLAVEQMVEGLARVLVRLDRRDM